MRRVCCSCCYLAASLTVEDEVIDLAEEEVQVEELATSESDCDDLIDEEDDFFANI